MDKRTKELMKFLDASRSVYHAVDYLKNILLGEGYTQLAEGEKWELIPGGKYFLTRGGTAVIAFRIPKEKACPAKYYAEYRRRSAFHLCLPALQAKIPVPVDYQDASAAVPGWT